MAIRLEAFFPVVQLSDIYVANTQSALNVRLEVIVPTVQFTDVTLVERASIPLVTAPLIGVGIQYQYMEMAKAVFQKMVAAGIWVDADTDNRILTDISTVIESLSAELDKPLTDTALINEIAAIAVSRPASDSTGVSDSSTLWAELGPIDEVTFAEALTFVIQSVLNDVAVIAEQHAIYMVRDPFTDSTGVQDLPRLHTTRPVEDVVNTIDGSSWSIDKGQPESVTLTEQRTFASTKPVTEFVALVEGIAGTISKPVTELSTISDALVVAQHFRRMYADSVALVDGVLVINGLAVQPSDAPITSDTAQWALGRLVTDTASVLETAHMELTKAAVDSAQTSDTFNRSAQFQRAFTDTIALDDISNVDKNWAATKQNVALVGDASQFNLTTAYSDSALVQEAYQYAANKSLTESIGASDVLSIQVTNGSIPVFNGVTFNSSTFG